MKNKVLSILIFISIFSAALFADDALPGGVKVGPIALPDISLIGNIIGDWNQDTNRVTFGMDELEMVVAGYIYPQVKADAVLSMSDAGLNIEEAYADFLSLLDIFSLKAGKMKIEFGKINILHNHVWPYADTPLVINNFLAGSLSENGASIGAVLPLPIFVKSETGLYNVEPNVSGIGIGLEPAADTLMLSQELYSERLSASFDPTEDSDLEIGASGAISKGSQYPASRDDVELAGADLTLKMWPVNYSRFLLQAEAMYMKREQQQPGGALDDIERWGTYVYAGYTLNKFVDIGSRYDWSEDAVAQLTKESKISAIFTYRVSEATFARLQYGYTPENKSNEVLLQFVYGLGPHTHPLQ
jgi:hypothetical protein